MNDTVSSPQSVMKESAPCSCEHLWEWLNTLLSIAGILEVPAAKRAMVFSTGSNSVKAKVEEDEIYFQDVSDSTVAVYAPNKVILEQVLPKVKALLTEDEVSVC